MADKHSLFVLHKPQQSKQRGTRAQQGGPIRQNRERVGHIADIQMEVMMHHQRTDQPQQKKTLPELILANLNKKLPMFKQTEVRPTRTTQQQLDKRDRQNIEYRLNWHFQDDKIRSDDLPVQLFDKDEQVKQILRQQMKRKRMNDFVINQLKSTRKDYGHTSRKHHYLYFQIGDLNFEKYMAFLFQIIKQKIDTVKTVEDLEQIILSVVNVIETQINWSLIETPIELTKMIKQFEINLKNILKQLNDFEIPQQRKQALRHTVKINFQNFQKKMTPQQTRLSKFPFTVQQRLRHAPYQSTQTQDGSS